MKKIEVVAAIIKKDDKFLITQRGYGEYKDYYEFPGGKIEKDETNIEALKREIFEELEATINVDEFLLTVEYDYKDFHLTMHTYICSLIDDHIKMKEHEDMRFINIEEIDKYVFLPADEIIINKLKETLKN